MKESNFGYDDLGALLAYFVVVIGFGIWSSLKNRGSVGGYFLAGRSMHWIPVGASLFASNIGSGHFIGIAGSAASVGIGSGVIELNALFTLILLGWVFLPVYIRAGVYTMPGYITKRFGGDRIRIYLSCLSLILYVFTKISADLFSGALFILRIVKIDLYVAVIILLVVSAAFTIGGGLTAVIWTDFIQTIIMLIGAFYLMITCFIEVGGYEQMITKFGYAVPDTILYNFTTNTSGIPPRDYQNLLRGVKSDYPWPGIIFGALISSIWYWCTDQVIVQRVLAAKNMDHARAGCIMAGILKFLPLFLIFYPGMISRVLYRNEIACFDPDLCNNFCENRNSDGCSNIAYPTLVIERLPGGARGLMLAVMISALMSSLTSVFNSSSTLFTMDIWKRARPKARDWEVMIVGRIFVLIIVCLSIAWIPVIAEASNSRLFDYIQSITSFLSPPICAVFLNAIFFKRINETGAFWSLMIGLVIGMIRFILEFAAPENPVVKEVHFLHFGMLLFGICTICMWVISLLTKPIPKKHLSGLTYDTIYDEGKAIPIPSSKGFGPSNFCSGANIDENDETNSIHEMHESKIPQNNITFENRESNENETEITVDSNESEAKVDEPQISYYKRAFFFICGIETLRNQKVDEHEDAPDVSIDTHPKWSKVLNVVALLVAATSGFVIAFFNKY